MQSIPRSGPIALLLAIAALAAAGPQAARAQERWDPISKTAMSITGPMSVFRDHVRFGNGAVLPMVVAGQPTDMVFDGQTMSALVYRVTVPRDPVLLRDNTLCGSGPVTWLIIASKGVDRMLAVYTGINPPPENKRLCGTYRFELILR